MQSHISEIARSNWIFPWNNFKVLQKRQWKSQVATRIAHCMLAEPYEYLVNKLPLGSFESWYTHSARRPSMLRGSPNWHYLDVVFVGGRWKDVALSSRLVENDVHWLGTYESDREKPCILVKNWASATRRIIAHNSIVELVDNPGW